MMNNTLTKQEKEDVNVVEMGDQLAFTKKLHSVTDKIHSATNIDNIILDVSLDICNLFEAQRITMYVVSDHGKSIVSKVKIGLDGYKEFKLPLTTSSIAGYCGVKKTLLNIKDVYDDAELKAIDKQLIFLKEVDKKTGFRAKQMLVFPITHPDDDSLMGVVQLINTLSDLPFKQMMVQEWAVIAKTLAIALNQRLSKTSLVKTKFSTLVAEGHISPDELEWAQRVARSRSKDLESLLINDFRIDPIAIAHSFSSFFDTPYELYVADRAKPSNLLENLKQSNAEENGWLPLYENKTDGLVILTTDPKRVKDSGLVAQHFPKHIKIAYRVCLKEVFNKTVSQFYEGDSHAGMMDEAAQAGEISGENDNELVKMVNKIIVDAYNQGASDIHIEPYPESGETQVRFRKDGSLVNYMQVPASNRDAMTARIKIMCDLDISEKRRPQDGKIKFKKYGPLDIELRVATIPSAGGMEDVVLRILAAGKPIPLDKLGLSNWNNEKIKQLIAKPYGLFFVCGPTGSGKTTTLHSALGYINKPETKIWTAEDPVEITQKGLRQVQINKKAGLDFATIMKAFLRADPDVIMVGEMRDKETVSIGIEASLTGHLVFATLHTNSAPESIVRLLDMGMEPFNFADALIGILAQRLAKRLCDCKKPYTPDAAEVKIMLDEYCEELKNTSYWQKDPEASYQAVHDGWLEMFGNYNGQLTLYKPTGCQKCNGTGYKGRVGLHELMEGTDAVKKNIQESARVAEMFATALEDGMRTLKQDGIEKVLQGITDMLQVRAVCIK